MLNLLKIVNFIYFPVVGMAELVYFNQQSVDKQNNFYILYSERFLFFTLSVSTNIWNPLKKRSTSGKKVNWDLLNLS